MNVEEQAEAVRNGRASITTVVTSPLGAEVYIDGTRAVVTPLQFFLE